MIEQKKNNTYTIYVVTEEELGNKLIQALNKKWNFGFFLHRSGVREFIICTNNEKFRGLMEEATIKYCEVFTDGYYATRNNE